MPNVLSPRDLVFRPDNMDETVQHTQFDTEDRSEQTVQTQIRLLLEEQSNQSLFCLLEELSDQRLCYTFIDSTIPLLSKSEISSL